VSYLKIIPPSSKYPSNTMSTRELETNSVILDGSLDQEGASFVSGSGNPELEDDDHEQSAYPSHDSADGDYLRESAVGSEDGSATAERESRTWRIDRSRGTYHYKCKEKEPSTSLEGQH
jgi:hypothetical protein